VVGGHLKVDYFALPFVPGDDVRYAYRLVGAADGWTECGSRRTVTYANLAPGRYRFEVRATDSHGAGSPTPAHFDLIVPPPFWRTPWFLGLTLLLTTCAGWLLHRTRLARALAVERLRTRIATDLHDDIGSNLSHMAILSEVTLKRSVRGSDTVEGLRRIAEVARESIDTMSDIVWAIDPDRDRLGDLVNRMRRFVNDLVATRSIDVTFTAPSDGLDLGLAADTKRQLYRVFKESLNNAVRHSDCSAIEVELSMADSTLRLAIRDDGRGFDSREIEPGQGLDSIRRRAESAGGRLRVRSSPGQGTEIRMEIPRQRHGG